MPDQPISDLAAQLLDREMAKNPEQFKVARPVSQDEKGMSPHTLATLGGLADAASTYAFMKRGTHKERNPLVNAIGGGNPEMTGLTALGGLLATKLATKAIGKKWPKLADAIAANVGAQQLAFGVNNTAKTFDKGHLGSRNDSGDKEWVSALTRSITQNVD